MKALECTAYHESGHAVASCILRVPFDKVTIEREGRILGSVFSRADGFTTFSGLWGPMAFHAVATGLGAGLLGMTFGPKAAVQR